MDVTSNPNADLGAKIRAARIDQRYDLRAAAKAAGIARDTWKKIESGESVHDTKRAAALQLLGLDWNGEPVGRAEQDEFVASPGARIPSGVTNDEVLQELRNMQQRIDELSRRLEDGGQQGS